MTRGRVVLVGLCVLAFALTLCGCSGHSGPTTPGMVTTATKPQPPPAEPTPSKIAFERILEKGLGRGFSQVFTINTDGTGEQQLTSGTSHKGKPSWGGDGRIAFTLDQDGASRIFVMNSDGSGQTAVTTPPEGSPGDDAPDWCLEDSDKIAFLRYREGTRQQMDIWMVNGNVETQLTTSDYADDWPSFAPKGDFVVFRRLDFDEDVGYINKGLHVVRVVDNAVWPLDYNDTPIEGIYPDWSADGTSIVYYQAGLWRLPMDPDTGMPAGAPELITSTSYYHPTASPLGDYLTAQTPQNRIVTLEADTGAILGDLASGTYPDWSPELSTSNLPPVANDDSASTTPGTAVTVDVLANDTDPNNDTLVVESVTQPANGSVVNNATNITYTPDDGFEGTDTFTYVVSDGNGGTDEATVAVSVGSGSQTGAVEGCVTQGGEGVDRATVTLTPDGGGDSSTTKTDAAGFYSFADVPGGSYTVIAKWRNLSKTSEPFDVGPGETVTQNIGL